MTSIVTVTVNPTLDKSTSVEQVVPDRKLRCKVPRREPGGGGINVSRAIKRLNGDSVAVYTSGGPTGQMLEQFLTEEGLAHHPITIDGWTRECLTVREDSTEQQYRFNTPGPNLAQNDYESVIHHLMELSQPPDYLVLSGGLAPGMPADYYRRIVETVPADRIIVDTHGSALKQVAASGVFLLKPNMRELRQLAESGLDTEAEIEAAAQSLIEQGNKAVVVSLGAAGVLFVTAERIQRMRAPTVKIRSKIGAGDSMIGGITLALDRGMELDEAVQFGMAAGSAAVMSPGTQLCSLDDTRQLYMRISDRQQEAGEKV